MTAKHLHFHDDARERILRGADQLARAVRVTLGPRGRTVILEREFGGPQIVNSGVLVARAVELEDPAENLGAQLLREVAARTSEQAGDGTTTAIVLAHAMLQEGQRYLAAGLNPVQVKRGIEQGVEAVVGELRRLARPCTSSTEIAHVAAISANNDRSIGDLLARAIDRVGRDGAITIEDGSGLASELNVVEGLQFDRGFLSPYFITDAERQACVLEDAALLLFDKRLSSVKDLLPLLEEVVKAGRPLLVVAEDADSEALATLVINTLRGTLKTCAVKAPGFGDRRRALLQDMAVLTGGTLISDEVGLPLSKATLAHLGRARRVEVTRDTTTVVGGGGAASAIAARVAQLRKEREAATHDADRTALDQRIAKLGGGVAVVKVGAATETELKERRIRIDDALHATRAAVEEGIVPGGGLALLRARRVLREMKGATLDEDSGLRIVYRALEEPLRRIVANAGQEPSVVVDRVESGCGAAIDAGLESVLEPSLESGLAYGSASGSKSGATTGATTGVITGAISDATTGAKTGAKTGARSGAIAHESGAAWGYNAATGAYGDLLQMGVIDPAKVTRLALQNAGSIAGLILMTDCLIVRPAARATGAVGPDSGVEDEPDERF